ncbi:MAG: response regulator [Burkholderiaceae bacterium]
MDADSNIDVAMRASLDLSPDGVMVFEAVRDDAGVIVDFCWRYVNEAAAGIVGRPRGWFIGRQMLREMPGNREEGLFDLYKRVTETGTVETRELDYQHETLRHSFRIVATPAPNGFVVSFSDITRRREAERALLQADHQKDQFLAVLSHELRNPLAGITHSLDILQSTLRSGDLAQRAYLIAVRQVAHLRRLIDDLLDVARIRADTITMTTRPVDLRETAEMAIDNLWPALVAKQIQIKREVSATPVMVSGDPVRLTQIIGNLLDNACKFSPPGAMISLRLRQDDERARLEVVDAGRGLEADEIAGLLERNPIGARRRIGDGAGLGLGLFLVRRLIEAHGGEVTVASDGAGKGSTFAIALPLSPMPMNVHAVSALTVPPASVRSGRRAILIVDDDDDAAESLSMLLELRGNDVWVAGNAQAALEAVRSRPVEVVLLDIGLPGVSGHELARLLRREPDGQRLALIALSGFGHAADIRASQDAGLDDHLVKPVAFGRLSTSIDRALGARRRP